MVRSMDDVGCMVMQEGRHPVEGGPHRLTILFATLDWATSKPSLSSSPWIRGAPHSGLSTLIRRISARSSASICGRPPRERDFQRQYRRKPSIQLDQEQAISVRELDTTANPPLQHNQLISERSVLCLKSTLRLERR